MEKNNSLINDEVGLKGYALDFTLAKNHLADETAVANAVKKHLANLEKELLKIANIEVDQLRLTCVSSHYKKSFQGSLNKTK